MIINPYKKIKKDLNDLGIFIGGLYSMTQDNIRVFKRCWMGVDAIGDVLNSGTFFVNKSDNIVLMNAYEVLDEDFENLNLNYLEFEFFFNGVKFFKSLTNSNRHYDRTKTILRAANLFRKTF